jgi:hypothetical protein
MAGFFCYWCTRNKTKQKQKQRKLKQRKKDHLLKLKSLAVPHRGVLLLLVEQTVLALFDRAHHPPKTVNRVICALKVQKAK